MFVLYVPAIMLVAALLLGGGRLDRLGTVRLRGIPAIALAMAIQGPLFGPLAGLLPAGHPVGLAAYIATSALVFGVVLMNVRRPGFVLVAAGAAANLGAIVANGGVMPTSPEALAVLGWSGDHAEFSNSALVAAPALPWLTDVFALPPWVPFANVFSVGDILIGLGIGAFLAVAVSGPGAGRSVSAPLDGAAARPGRSGTPALSASTFPWRR